MQFMQHWTQYQAASEFFKVDKQKLSTKLISCSHYNFSWALKAIMGHPLNVQHLQVSLLFFHQCLKLHHPKGHQWHGGTSNASKLVVMFQAPLGSIDQTLIQMSREGFVKEYLGILFLLLIERKTKFAGMMGEIQRFFLTAFQWSRFLLHCQWKTKHFWACASLMPLNIHKSKL